MSNDSKRSRMSTPLNEKGQARSPPPSEILADPVVLCRKCRKSRVLPGVPGKDEGLCHECWLDSLEGASRRPEF